MIAFINGVVLLITLAVVIGLPIWLIMRSRGEYLRGLDRQALGSLGRVTKSLFDAQPTTYTDKTGGSRVEGKRGGETFAVRAAFTKAANGNYMRRGYKHNVSADTSVIVGLKGATPKLVLRPRGEAPSLETDFARAFDIEADEGILDDATKALVMAFLARGPRVTAIRVDAEGLHVEWRSAAGLTREMMPTVSAEALANADRGEADAIALVVDFEQKLRDRIVEVVERRAAPHVRVDAYRDENAEPLEEAEAEEAAAARLP